MPASIVAGEGVQLVYDDGLEVLEEHAGLRAARDEHDLDGLGCREQKVGPFLHDGPPSGGADVAVPERDTPADQGAVGPKARLDVVEQSLDRTDVEHAQPAPAFGQHP